jgi:hypothetical protein
MEIANSVEPVQDGRIFIDLLNRPSCSCTRAALQDMAQVSSARLIAAGSGCEAAPK